MEWKEKGCLAEIRDFAMKKIKLCSNCFHDQGLRLDAKQLGSLDNSICPQCRSSDGSKLTEDLIKHLAHRFFVRGTIIRQDYGAAPIIQFNDRRSTDNAVPPPLDKDMRLFEDTIGVGFFRYEPRQWMIGEVEPLKALQERSSRLQIIEQILGEYPTVFVKSTQLFFRLRINPSTPKNPGEYDSPPCASAGTGRFDTTDFPVMYGSPDLETCIHECRVTVEDELYVATLSPTRNLKMLHLAVLLKEEKISEFESLDMAVHMLFLAGEHSYEITREIAQTVQSAGYDGIIYPSYFTLLRTGSVPFDTIYGISVRRFPTLQKREQSKTIPNIALFGHPIRDRKVTVQCINKLILDYVQYRVCFGPVGFE